MTRRGWALGLGSCAALAAASLLLPLEPTFDPWAWVIWGREGLGLDTGGGPSWKPLPVIVSWALASFGDAAPDLWLLISRAGWLASALVAAVLAWRLADAHDRPSANDRVDGADRPPAGRRILAAGVAAAAVLLIDDPATPWLRQFAGGLSEPLLLALILAAVEAHLAGRRRLSLGLLVAAALLRPEVWPFLALYGSWLWGRDSSARGWIATIAVAIPVLWFVPDLLGSGDALTGADRARDAGGGVQRVPAALGDAVNLAPLALLVAAVSFAGASRRRGNEVPAGLLAAALTWTVVVVLLTAAGFAGLPRFFVPVAGIVAVLGSVGIVALLASAGPGRLLAAILILGLLAQAGFRIADLPGDYERSVERSDEVRELWAFVDRAGAGRLTSCAPLRTSDPVSQSALVWKLEVPFSKVDVIRARAPQEGIVMLGPYAAAPLSSRIARAGERIAEHGRWSAYAISCSARDSSASGARTLGVSGAVR